MEHRSTGTKLAALAAAGVLFGGLCIAGIAAQVSVGAADAQEGAASYATWKQTYPDQYGSFATHYYDSADGDEESHYMFRFKQDAYGDPMTRTGACMSCKTTSIDAMYAEYGDAMFQMTVAEGDFENKTEAYWDCAGCHTSVDDLTLGANQLVFGVYGADEFADIDPEILVCGQCHNASGAFTYNVNAENPLGSFEPYKYGHDADGLYRSYDENMSAVDEATGAALSTLSYDDLEMFIDSTHYSLGLTCVDCHMTETVDENGNIFTSHNASSSPLQNPEALELCLGCHRAQGVEDAQAMVDLFFEVEGDLAAKMAEAQAATEQLAAALAEATAAGVEGEAVNQARLCYSQAYFFNQYVSSYRCDGHYRVAHNADYMNELAGRMLQLAQEGLELLA